MEKDVEKKKVFRVAFAARFGYDVLMMFTDATDHYFIFVACEGDRDHPWHDVWCPACAPSERTRLFDPDDYMM